MTPASTGVSRQSVGFDSEQHDSAFGYVDQPVSHARNGSFSHAPHVGSSFAVASQQMFGCA
jgi:hypothetical protein